MVDKGFSGIDPDKMKALDGAFAQINKKYGKKDDKAVMLFGEAAWEKAERIPTGSVNLDIATGGGYPVGRIIEIYGPESSGKTLLTINAIAQAQKLGKIAAFIDAEHAFDPDWAARNGVDIDSLIISQPSSGEEGLEIAEMLVRSGVVDIIVIDSVAALTPGKELEGSIGDSHVGLQARMMSQALRKITGLVSETKTTVFFINQLREKVGVMFGSPETTTGGKALKFYASVRLDTRRIAQVKDGGETVGITTKVKVVKNKTFPPFKEAVYNVLTEGPVVGIQREAEALEKGIDMGLVQKAGAWYTLPNGDRAQGELKAAAILRESPEEYDKLLNAIYDKYLPKPEEAGDGDDSLDELAES